MPGAGSDRVGAHRNIVRGIKKYNILEFEANRTENQTLSHVTLGAPGCQGRGRIELVPIQILLWA